MRRHAEPAAGWWDVPGGFLEEGEPPEEGVRREAREELGVELQDLRLLMVDVNPLAQGPVLDVLFEASCLGEPQAGSDASEIGWFAPEALPDDLAFESTRRILDRWRASRGLVGCHLLGGDRVPPRDAEMVSMLEAPLAQLPPGWRVECGEWQAHDGFLCGRIEGERPAVVWLDRDIEGDHMLSFTAWAVPPHRNDLNCIWEGTGRLQGEPPEVACTIAGVGGWGGGLTGIERYPEGGLRATARLQPIEGGRRYRITAGRRASADFLFVDGRLALQLDDPSAARRKHSRVALATWNSHVHIERAVVYRVTP